MTYIVLKAPLNSNQPSRVNENLMLVNVLIGIKLVVISVDSVLFLCKQSSRLVASQHQRMVQLT